MTQVSRSSFIFHKEANVTHKPLLITEVHELKLKTKQNFCFCQCPSSKFAHILLKWHDQNLCWQWIKKCDTCRTVTSSSHRLRDFGGSKETQLMSGCQRFRSHDYAHLIPPFHSPLLLPTPSFFFPLLSPFNILSPSERALKISCSSSPHPYPTHPRWPISPTASSRTVSSD